MSSLAPLAGRLSQIFSPSYVILVSSVIFGLGGIVTSRAQSLPGFLAGRAISGIGGAGVLTISTILVLELVTKKRRGLFIGLINTCYTTGVAVGAILSGAMLPISGWVSTEG